MSRTHSAQHKAGGNESLPFRRIYRGNLPLATCVLQLGKDSHKRLDTASRALFAGWHPPTPQGQTQTAHPASACSCLPSGGFWNTSKEKMGEEKHIHDKNQLRKMEI